MIKHPILKVLFCAIPLVALLGILCFKTGANSVLRPQWQQVQYPTAGDIHHYPAWYNDHAIYVVSDLSYRFSRPHWWPHEGMNMLRSLTFVSATIEDSKGQHFSTQEKLNSSSEQNDHPTATPPRNPYVPEVDSLRRRSWLLPSAALDLSHGGKMTVTLEVRENEYDPFYDPNHRPYWQGSYTIPLPPMPNHVQLESVAPN